MRLPLKQVCLVPFSSGYKFINFNNADTPCEKKKNIFMAPFHGWSSTASRLEPLRGGSLFFTTKFPEIHPRKDERLSLPWSHPVVLKTGHPPPHPPTPLTVSAMRVQQITCLCIWDNCNSPLSVIARSLGFFIRLNTFIKISRFSLVKQFMY